MRRVKVILQQDYPKLGFVGDEVEIRGGYARNFLIPRGIAFEASEINQKYLKHRLSGVTAKKIKLRSEAENILKVMEGMIPEFTLRIGEGGKSFGSITNREISKWLDEKGYSLDRSQIIISDPIKKVGEHQIRVKLHSEVVANMKVRVAPEVVQAAPVAEGQKSARRAPRGRTRKSVESEETEQKESVH